MGNPHPVFVRRELEAEGNGSVVPLGIIEMLPFITVIAIHGTGISCDCVGARPIVVFAYQVDQINRQFAAGRAVDTEVIPVRLTIPPIVVGLALDGASEMGVRQYFNLSEAGSFKVRVKSDCE